MLDMSKITINLDDALKRVNDYGDGIWKFSYEIKEEDGRVEIWLIDEFEYVTSYNFYDDHIWRRAIYPFELAVQEQTGDESFYFEPFNYAGRFVGCVS